MATGETSSQGQKGSRTAIYFVSDAHFGAESFEAERARLDKFLAFLRHARTRAKTLYIVGDLFDFWFEYKQVLPKTHVMIFTELAALMEAGVEVWYLAGNHDFWIGDFFSKTLGISISLDPMTLDIDGRRVYLTHGDDLTAGHDHGYRFLRRLVRSKLAIGAYHWIHPDLGIPFARWASRSSRGYSTAKKFVLNKTLGSAIEKKFIEGYDVIIMGHIHYADHLHYENGECLMLGDWITAFTYLIYEDGGFRLHQWENETEASG